MKRVLSAILAVAMLFILVTGCGNNNKVDKAEATTEVGTSLDTTAVDAKDQVKEVDIKSLSGTVTFWTWEIQGVDLFKKQLEAINPNIKINGSVLDFEQMYQKLKTSTQAGVGLPDFTHVETSWAAEFAANPAFEDLLASPYNAGELKDKFYDFYWKLSQGSDGTMKLFPLSPGMGACFYRRDIAKQYFGTDDPDELEKMMPTLEDAFEKGKELLEKSGGKVFMTDTAEMIYMQQVAVQGKPYVSKDAKLQLEETCLLPLKLALKWRNAKLDGKFDQWSPAWNGSITQGNVFMYYSGSWGERWMIQDNDKDKKTEGKWGVMAMPGGTANFGGNFLAIPKDSKNKELAWNIIKYIVTQPDSAGFIQYLKENAAFPAVKSVVDLPEFNEEMPLFSGQKARLKYAQLGENMKIQEFCRYDKAVQTALGPKVKDMLAGKLSPEEVIKQTEDQLLKQFQGKLKK